jgi:hypothetical protein
MQEENTISQIKFERSIWHGNCMNATDQTRSALLSCVAAELSATRIKCVTTAVHETEKCIALTLNVLYSVRRAVSLIM